MIGWAGEFGVKNAPWVSKHGDGVAMSTRTRYFFFFILCFFGIPCNLFLFSL
jgi:hypothetical protein